MTFEWGEFLEFAKTLHLSTEIEPAEARKRSVVSRAYYAAFLTARDYAFKNLQLEIYKTDNPHDRVIQRFKERGRKYRVHSELLKLRLLRNNCDYECKVENLNYVEETSLESAKVIIEMIKTP